MTGREKTFLQSYTQSIYLMRLAKYNLLMAKEHCDHSSVKQALNLAATSQDVRIADITLKLKGQVRYDLQRDINSDDLQATGAVLLELLQAENILDIEDELIQFIREKREVFTATI